MKGKKLFRNEKKGDMKIEYLPFESKWGKEREVKEKRLYKTIIILKIANFRKN
jgi:hypothetical protein